MNGQQHTIRKFSLKLQMSGGNEAYSLQRKCSDLIKNELVTGLDELLNTYFDEAGITRIQRIELDIGNIAAADLEDEFADRCLQQLSEKLKTISLQGKPAEEIIVEQLGKERYIIDQFFYFLCTGQLPAPARLPAIDDWKEEVLIAIKRKKEYFREQFIKMLANYKQIADRLALQFDEAFIEVLFNSWEPDLRKEMTELMLRSPIIIEKVVTQFGDEFIEGLFYTYEPLLRKEITELMPLLQKTDLQNPSLQFRKKILAALLEVLYKTQGHKMVSIVQEINERLCKRSTDLIAGQFSSQSEHELELVLKQLKPGFSAGEAKEFQKKDVLNLKEEITKKDVEKKDVIKDEAKETAVFIDNAGLVILHPFLNTLFEKTGLMHNNSFLNDEAKSRAVHLLQYMADGLEQLPEYLMPLNKVLCGLPDDIHIDRFVVLTHEEKKEAGELLKAVIAHWAALKNSSVEALQETFLQRRGKLSFIEEDHYWKLQIERRAFDILLDKLPWGYSYIQLPWMKHKLITEW